MLDCLFSMILIVDGTPELLTTHDSIVGIAALFGVVVMFVLGAFSIGESRIGRIVDNRLREPTSDFTRHRGDENAHEAMRNKLGERFEESLDRLRSDMTAFQTSVIKPIVATNQALMENQTKALQMLERSLERQGRRRSGDQGED